MIAFILSSDLSRSFCSDSFDFLTYLALVTFSHNHFSRAYHFTTASLPIHCPYFSVSLRAAVLLVSDACYSRATLLVKNRSILSLPLPRLYPILLASSPRQPTGDWSGKTPFAIYAPLPPP